jgi:hypothetical protein
MMTSICEAVRALLSHEPALAIILVYGSRGRGRVLDHAVSDGAEHDTRASRSSPIIALASVMVHN